MVYFISSILKKDQRKVVRRRKMEQFTKGSEWRRWDLHIHTPGTQKNDQFEGKTIEEKWDKYYLDIADYIGNGTDPLKNIAVMGVTDYLSVDNYKKVINDHRLPASIKLVIPNVEMRIAPVAKDKPVNIHCLFNPNIVDELETRFFGKLKFQYQGRTINVTHHELRRLGREVSGNKSLNDEAAYRRGIDQCVLTLDSIREVFSEDTDLRNNAIVVVSNSSNDGASGVSQRGDFIGIDGSQLDTVKNEILYFADMIFSSKETDIQYFLGHRSDSTESIIMKYRSLKPCIHGSDAHTNEKIFSPKDDRYCWIKADPTFNGLRQVLYEPDSRVRISPIVPETKTDYQVIDRVVIADPDFSDVPIQFNDKLTCIIGGKSTGKSLLLNNMAQNIDSEQYLSKKGVTNGNSKQVASMSVFWADGSVSKLGNMDNPHKVIYIPQTYLNRLSDNQEEITEIDRIIHDIITLNEDTLAQYNNMKKELAQNKVELDRKIFDCVRNHEEIVLLQGKLSEIGTRSGIEKEIEKLKEQKGKLTQSTNISSDEILQYDEATNVMSSVPKEIKRAEQMASSVLKLDKVVEPIQIPEWLSPFYQVEMNAIVTEIVEEANQKWIVRRAELESKIEAHKAGLLVKKDEAQQIFEKFDSTIKSNEAISKLSEALVREEQKLSEYNEQASIIEQKETEYFIAFTQLIQLFCSFYTTHQAYSNFITNNPDLSCDDLEFSSLTRFRSENFASKVTKLFDGRQLRSKGIIDIDNISESDISEERISEIIRNVIEGKLKLTGGCSVENALRELLSDWYNSVYQVTMDNDKIDEMSPGKKALVLLKMLINLAESKCPILIDQPEDDLDNRSIFTELIPFIKKKKVDRQIIIVTHNANVVLGADAEEIIVANQSGKNSPNKTYRFEYRSGAIENDMAIPGDEATTLGKRGIQQHICDVLEGGQDAFDLRMHKYRLS